MTSTGKGVLIMEDFPFWMGDYVKCNQLHLCLKTNNKQTKNNLLGHELLGLYSLPQIM